MNDQTKANTRYAVALAAAGCALSIGLAIGFQPGPPTDTSGALRQELNAPKPVMLLVESQPQPEIELRWQTPSGWMSEVAQLPYTSPHVRTTLDSGVEAFVALGGTRLDKGAGDPKGVIVRIGFYRSPEAEVFLPGIQAGGWVEVELAGVRFNQQVSSSTRSIVQHIKFSDEALEACGAPAEMRDVYATANPNDDLGGDLLFEPGARMGFFAGELTPRLWGSWEPRIAPAETLGGFASVVLKDNITGTLRVAFPYSALRHVVAQGEPPIPGQFSEPDHFHFEFEAVPLLDESGDS